MPSWHYTVPSGVTAQVKGGITKTFDSSAQVNSVELIVDQVQTKNKASLLLVLKSLFAAVEDDTWPPT